MACKGFEQTVLSSKPKSDCSASDTLAGFAASVPRLVPIPRFEEFQAAMRQGLRISSPHFVLHCCARAQAAPAPSRIGALLPKRWAKKAVRRNLLRRKIYALAAGHLPALSQAAGHSLDCVVRLRASWSAADYPSASSAALRLDAGQELAALFAQAQQKIHSRGAAAFTSAPSHPRPAAPSPAPAA